eukprot:1151493-Pelagomonas_calceolata.AAC.2
MALCLPQHFQLAILPCYSHTSLARTAGSQNPTLTIPHHRSRRCPWRHAYVTEVGLTQGSGPSSKHSMPCSVRHPMHPNAEHTKWADNKEASFRTYHVMPITQYGAHHPLMHPSPSE